MEKYCPRCSRRYSMETERCEDDGTVLVVDPDRDLTGQVVDGRYTVLERIGKGGMGVVYRAEQHLVKRPVALKVLRKELAQDESAVRRFMTEAQAIASLSNRHTVTLHDVGVTSDGLIYFTMELLGGKPLSALIANEAPLDVMRAGRLVCQVCESLEEAHGKGVLHRDLKPDNLFVVEERGREFAKVLDFGIAKLIGDGAGESVTRTGMLVGTPQYLSPEQALGMPALPASDLYSLAVVFFEMLVGVPPFKADTPMKTVWAHLREPVPEISLRNPYVTVPRDVEQFLRRALDKDARRRFRSASEFREGLKAILGDCVTGTGLIVLSSRDDLLVREQYKKAREHLMTLSPVRDVPVVVGETAGGSTWSMETVQAAEGVRGRSFGDGIQEQGALVSPSGDTVAALAVPEAGRHEPLVERVWAEERLGPTGHVVVTEEIGEETMTMLAAHRRRSLGVWLGLGLVVVLLAVAVWFSIPGGEKLGGDSQRGSVAGVGADGGSSGSALSQGDVLGGEPEGGRSGGGERLERRSADVVVGSPLDVGEGMDVVGLDAIEDVASVGSAGVGVGDGSPRQGVDLPGGVVESADATGADGNSGESGGDVAGGSDTEGGVVEAEWKVLALEAARAMDEGRYEEATALLGRAKRAGGPDSELKPMLAEAYRRARAPLDAEGEAAVKAAEKRERDAARKRAEEAKRREEELQRKAEEARQREEELQRKAEEARQKEEELQRKAEEARQKEAERRRLEELRRREAEAEAKKRGEVEARGREAMTRGLEARAARRWRDCVRELELAVGAGVATAEARRQLKYCKEQLMYE